MVEPCFPGDVWTSVCQREVVNEFLIFLCFCAWLLAYLLNYLYLSPWVFSFTLLILSPIPSGAVTKQLFGAQLPTAVKPKQPVWSWTVCWWVRYLGRIRIDHWPYWTYKAKKVWRDVSLSFISSQGFTYNLHPHSTAEVKSRLRMLYSLHYIKLDLILIINFSVSLVWLSVQWKWEIKN